MIPSLELGSDAFGTGAAVSGITGLISSRNVEGCGSKPFCCCTKNCREKKASYDACISRQQALMQQQIAAQTQIAGQQAQSKMAEAESENSQQTTIIVIAAAALVVIIALIFLFKK